MDRGLRSDNDDRIQNREGESSVVPFSNLDPDVSMVQNSSGPALAQVPYLAQGRVDLLG